MSALWIFPIWLVSWPFIALWRGYCVVVMWGWFVAPHFGVATPSIYAAVGAMFVLHVALPFRRDIEQDNQPHPVAGFIGSLLAYGVAVPAAFLGVGWLWKWLQWGVA